MERAERMSAVDISSAAAQSLSNARCATTGAQRGAGGPPAPGGGPPGAPVRTSAGLRFSSLARAVMKERIASASSGFSEFLNEIMPFSASAPSTTMALNKSGGVERNRIVEVRESAEHAPALMAAGAVALVEVLAARVHRRVAEVRRRVEHLWHRRRGRRQLHGAVESEHQQAVLAGGGRKASAGRGDHRDVLHAVDRVRHGGRARHCPGCRSPIPSRRCRRGTRRTSSRGCPGTPGCRRVVSVPALPLPSRCSQAALRATGSHASR